MGKPSSTDTDRAVSALSGSLSAGQSSAPVVRTGKFNVSIWGVSGASVALERSFDGGVTWLNCTTPGGAPNAFTANASVVCEEPEDGVLYRLTCAAGTANFRISQ